MQDVTVTGAAFTGDADPRSTIKPGRPAIHRLLVPFPVAYFMGAFVTDLAYWRTAAVMWERFSVWLITVGLIMAGVAIIAGVIDLAAGRQIDKPAWPRVYGFALAVLLSLMNVFVHSRDGYTAVVPTGVMLSGLVTVILLMTVWVNSVLTYRHRVGAGT